MDILEIEEKIGKVFNKTTPTGRLSKVKTRNLTSFLCVLVMIGIEKIKKDHDEKTFKKYMEELKRCGITEEYIRKEHQKERFKRKNQKVEYVELIFDLNNQVPAGYEPPKSQYNIEEMIGKKLKI
ncbi:phage/plasmid replication domain-containing protein [Acinetobacter nosocomialis]|uniref:Replication-associated protein G2P C-terminal domain-containing protein n=1 Tax=Acinetobacter nosocomialis TaxID=106654 RepID=A0A2L1VGK7_ACINO|nr:phage/plasmid replication protein [Acinetobacter nosocomialis]AVF44253.1 hypothetical protein AL533_07580 [Acinetobacter nosocomialis]AVF44257.1 hypothetical protein AL533_07600 [Acinetobacter nosocomialis]MBP1503181.1 hypothetical protein [Acinetobacter nosocomialis]HDG9767684.1 hypothetical protein [Acinetobacter nosocomialis]